MDWRKFGFSLIHAARGIRDLWRTQQNFRLEVVIGVLVLLAAVWFELRPIEKAVIVMMVMFELVAEAANSVLENILDGVSKNFSPRFRVAKDMLAGLTLVVAMCSAVVGVVIFYPYVLKLLLSGYWK